jgi:hypothetical protein
MLDQATRSKRGGSLSMVFRLMVSALKIWVATGRCHTKGRLINEARSATTAPIINHFTGSIEIP